MSDETGDPTIASLEAIQNFDPAMIARTETLGSVFDFTPAMPAVGQVVDFFRLLPKQLVPSLPDAQRTQVQVQADACWGTIQQMMQFDPNTNPRAFSHRIESGRDSQAIADVIHDSGWMEASMDGQITVDGSTVAGADRG